MASIGPDEFQKRLEEEYRRLKMHTPSSSGSILSGGALNPNAVLNAGVYNPKNPFEMLTEPGNYGQITMEAQLAIRMNAGRIPPGQRIGVYGKLEVHKVVRGAERVYMFCLHNGKAVTVEDDPLLYPSDALVAKIRLLGDQ